MTQPVPTGCDIQPMNPTKGHTMALLDLQTMESDEHTGGGGNSTVSLLSCVSATSVLLCL
ncbi:hypothetical protein Saso_54360 [Streptomyces asoensis]|uniref:AmfS protein n=1 Tax=Streptomyces asoensis TaxID=249586 RepID=A0ABQ3S6Q2_9ACTN|nr:hypothetical protein GCM10010496_47270 [Streptomyces asoensis]GHI63786.1 hypothetical protein Saso_54360 [Streptomyces asoensis]